MTRNKSGLAEHLLAWHAAHGRKGLPWQRDRSAYAVWVSEIMLQQTQVTTVIPYFERFMRRFPDAAALAAAGEDEVLHHWSGLGYYSRARHLHAAARRMVREHGGRPPRRFEDWLALPGVGRSTAGAIMALSQGEPRAILDGNVKRVLCRYHRIETWPGAPETEKALWTLAQAHTPDKHAAEYTQAIMDLGATVCVRRRPRCRQCPLSADCRARRDGVADALPAPRPKKPRPLRSTRFLILRDADRAVLLIRRPPAGVWGGLWGFPECGIEDDPARACRQRFGLEPRTLRHLAPLEHGFTHFRLEIEPVLLDVDARAAPDRVMEAGSALWYNCASPSRLGLAAPVRRILDTLAQKDATGTP